MTQNSKISLKIISAFAVLVAHPSWAVADPILEEIPVLNSFIAARGFDSNDNVQVVLDVELPDACYTPPVVESKIDNQKKVISLSARSWRRSDGVCATHEAGEGSTVMIVHDLGLMSKGGYKIAFQPEVGGQFQEKNFAVSQAKETTMDDLNYASVTNIGVNDFYYPSENIKIVISGKYNPSCERIVQPVAHEVLGDTLVVKPITERIAGSECLPQVDQFKLRLPARKMKAGQYLIHVRSKNGTSMNRLFTVVSPLR